MVVLCRACCRFSYGYIHAWQDQELCIGNFGADLTVMNFDMCVSLLAVRCSPYTG